VTYSTLLLDIRAGVAHIRLNRPDAYNGLNLTMAEELADAALRCGNDPAVRAVLLSGEGRVFSAGGDLNDFTARGSGIKPYIEELTAAFHLAVSRLVRMAPPVIAAVQGSAAGGGMSLAIACDLVVAAESARFTMAYTRIGLCPDGSSSYFLPRLVGLKRALDLILTNRVLGAQEALEWGLVSRVVPDAELMSEAETLARNLAAGPTAAFGLSKRLVQSGWTETLETQMALETQAISSLTASDDAREGIQAFLEKRPARFGRT
jgi:2-(1,2-epoxy-1,2-dihydrophenyl)acetyl-CoA isomerase